jgi:hypothetical protein
MQQGGNNRG